MKNINIKLLIILTLSAFFIFIGVYLFAFSRVRVYSNITGAEIFIDGKSKGTTPRTVILLVGDHTINLSTNIYESQKKELRLKPLKIENVYLEMDCRQVIQNQESLSQEEILEATKCDDKIISDSEKTLRGDYPIIGFLPYTDPDIRFSIYYNGVIENNIFKIKVFGSSPEEITANKKEALLWMKDRDKNSNKYKVEFEEQLLDSGPSIDE